ADVGRAAASKSGGVRLVPGRPVGNGVLDLDVGILGLEAGDNLADTILLDVTVRRLPELDRNSLGLARSGSGGRSRGGSGGGCRRGGAAATGGEQRGHGQPATQGERTTQESASAYQHLISIHIAGSPSEVGWATARYFVRGERIVRPGPRTSSRATKAPS